MCSEEGYHRHTPEDASVSAQETKWVLTESAGRLAKSLCPDRYHNLCPCNGCSNQRLAICLSEMSSRCASSSISDERSIRPRINSVSRNVARDDAFQMNNGYLKVDKLFINCQQFDLTAHIAASRILKGFRAGVLYSDGANPILNVQKTERKELKPPPPPRGPVQQPDMKWITSTKKAISAPSGRYLHLYSRFSGKYTAIFGRIDATISGAFIAQRIVNSFGLSPSGTSPSGDYVDLTCDTGPGKEYKSYRFRILDGCPFDVCIGTSLQPLSSLVGKSREGTSEFYQ